MAALALNTFKNDDDYAEAEAILEALSAEYPAYARADIEQMTELLATIVARSGRAAEEIDAMFQVAHNVKGQGASFGYDLMTHLGEALCELLRGQEMLPAPAQKRAIDLVAACETVLDNALRGDGGPVGQALLGQFSVGLTGS